MDYIKQDCPLCKNAAEYRFDDSDNYKVFHCGVCKVFAISRTAESTLTKHAEQWATVLSKRAQELKEDQLLRIRSGEPGSSEPIRISVEPKSDWKT